MMNDRIYTNRGLALHLLAGLLLFLTALAANAAEGRLFVSSEKDHAVHVFAAETVAKLATIKTSKRPRWLAFSPDRKHLYVACGDGDSIDVIDPEILQVVGHLDVGEDPEMFDLSPDGRFLYASNEDDGLLTVLDLQTKQIVAEVEVGDEPEGVLSNPDGSQIYVASEVSNMVHVIDSARHRLVANIVVGNRPRRFVLAPQRELWVSNELGASLSIIDLNTQRVSGSIDFLPPGFRRSQVTPVGMAITRDGKRVYVALGRANHLAVVDVAQRKVVDYVLLGQRPWGMALSGNEERLYVTNGLSDDLSVIDTRSLKVLRSVPVGRVPHSVVVMEP